MAQSQVMAPPVERKKTNKFSLKRTMAMLKKKKKKEADLLASLDAPTKKGK